MVTLMLIVGAIIVCGVVYALVKGADARITLIGSGILMAAIGGVPMAALDAFAKSMTNSRVPLARRLRLVPSSSRCSWQLVSVLLLRLPPSNAERTAAC